MNQPPATDLDFVGQILEHRLRQDDIRKLLQKLSESDRESFTERLADSLRKTAGLLDVSRRMADSLSLDVLLPRLVEVVCEFLDAERASVFLHDEETDELYTKAAVGLTREIRFPASQGIAGAVFRSGESVHIPDAYGDPRFSQEVDRQTGFRTRDILCGPIRHTRESGERITVGVAQVLNKRHGGFTPEDAAMLETLASQSASAFVNARLHQQITRARAEETQLLELTTAMTTELQLHPLLQKIMETVVLILEAERATLFVHDRKTGELWALVDDGQEIRFPSHLGIAGSVFTTGEAINIPDAYADSRFNPEVDRRTSFKTRSILCMPVVNRKGERIAVTQALNRKGGPFTAIDEKRLRAFSAQAAIAMENAQLFDEVVKVKNYAEAILESMSNGVVTFDAEGNIAKLNSMAARLLRREDGSAVGMTARAFLTGRNAWICGVLEAVQRSGQPQVAMDVDLQLVDDEVPETFDRRRRTASVNLSMVPIADGMGCMLVIDDITNEKRLKSTMARYMTKEVADRLLEEGEAGLGGKIQKATVLFTDIRSFTAISERIGPVETVKLLNEYFGLMVDVLFERGGVLDKYIGDAIMAVFGAPVAGPDDADHAVQAAIGMLRALHGFNAPRLAAGQAPVLMGVGINTDEVLSGNIGSLKRMDFTVIGDGVNLASRLEGANKPYGTQILISELTRAELRQSYLLREVDRMQVKGKSRPVGVFEVLDHLGGEDRERVLRLLPDYQVGLSAYQARDWGLASEAFERALLERPDDGPSRLYAGRARHFGKNPPPDDWDGVWVLKDK
jgi:adenylate cyclase